MPFLRFNMPNKPRTTCNHPGCPMLADKNGYCDRHQGSVYQRDKSRQALYDHRWSRASKAFLADILCVRTVLNMVCTNRQLRCITQHLTEVIATSFGTKAIGEHLANPVIQSAQRAENSNPPP